MFINTLHSLPPNTTLKLWIITKLPLVVFAPTGCSARGGVAKYPKGEGGGGDDFAFDFGQC